MNIQSRTIIKLAERQKPHLIFIDLDGTSLDGTYKNLHELNVRVLKHLISLGHEICILTGKNLPSAREYYDHLGLSTYIGTYNGAHLSNPSDLSKVTSCSPISNHIFNKIINDPRISPDISNYFVDSATTLQTMANKQGIYLQEVFSKSPQICQDIPKELNGSDLFQIVIEFPKNTEIFERITSALKDYSTAISFSVLKKLKEETAGSKKMVLDDTSFVIRIRSSSIHKGNAAKWLSTYYNIPVERVIAIGDDENDRQMIEWAGTGVAMANANEQIKLISNEITPKDNKSGGVGHYLIKKFRLENEFSNDLK